MPMQFGKLYEHYGTMCVSTYVFNDTVILYILYSRVSQPVCRGTLVCRETSIIDVPSNFTIIINIYVQFW